MWARIRFDITWSDLAFGLLSCVFARDRARLQQTVEHWWSSQDDALACFSVRSGFDLLLQALRLPPKSEVLFSALNIKQMIKIVKSHDLVPVPVDLELDHMGPNLEALERAITPRSRAIVVAHLFGTRLYLDRICHIAKQHNLLVIEDCAQAFDGETYKGHPSVDVSMFSFGPLKTATALGGALLKVRSPELLKEMRVLQSAYPIQTRRAYLVRLLKFAGLKILTSRAVFGITFRFFQARGQDYENSISDAVRGVAQLGSPKKLCHQPSAALLAVLIYRLKRWNRNFIEERAKVGSSFVEILNGMVPCPGTKNSVHTYWVFPILAEDPPALIGALRLAGFDAARLARSETVAPPEDRPELAPIVARDVLAKMVILPCYPGMPIQALKRQAAVVKEVITKGRI